MATLTIRNVDVAMRERLRVRAVRHGRSMEAEVRCILDEALESGQEQEPNLAEAIRRRFAPLGGVDLEPHPSVPVANAAFAAPVREDGLGPYLARQWGVLADIDPDLLEQLEM
jgi:plasmid stability protein